VAKLLAFSVLVAALLGVGSLTRGALHLSPVQLVQWQCPACHCANVSDAAVEFYPNCRRCGERLGGRSWAVADSSE